MTDILFFSGSLVLWADAIAHHNWTLVGASSLFLAGSLRALLVRPSSR